MHEIRCSDKADIDYLGQNMGKLWPFKNKMLTLQTLDLVACRFLLAKAVTFFNVMLVHLSQVAFHRAG
jgi:hypothetical protein